MRKIIKIKVILFFFILLFPGVYADNNIFKIHFIDIGEGDAILIQTPHNKNILIDTGNIVNGVLLSKYLQKNKVKSIDYLILTHPHLDHIGGLFTVAQIFKIRKFFDNGDSLKETEGCEDIYFWYEKIVRDKKYRYKRLKKGDILSLDGVKIKILWPPYRNYSRNYNTNSIVMMVSIGRFRCLLTGDLNMAGERELMKFNNNLSADILKVGHHGAKDTASRKFLKSVSPQISIISVDKNNRRNYPSPMTLKRLREEDIKTFITGRDGNIIVYINRQGKFKIRIKEMDYNRILR